MSAPSIIAAITDAIRDRLEALAVGTVTLLPPATMTENASGTRLNVFCYRTSVNPAFANDPAPDPARKSLDPYFPPLSLNLHYCVTAHSADETDPEFFAQLALANAMQAMHRRPRFDPSEIDPVNGVDPLRQGEVAVRIEAEPMSIDDLSKVWSSFQAEFHLSAFYQVSMVLIDGLERTPPLPVLSRNIDAAPREVASLGAPRFPGGRPAVFAGETVTLRAGSVPPGSQAWVYEVGGDLLGSLPLVVDGVTLTFVAAEPMPPGLSSIVIGPALPEGGPDLALASSAVPIALAPEIESVEVLPGDAEEPMDDEDTPDTDSVDAAEGEPSVVIEPTESPLPPDFPDFAETGGVDEIDEVIEQPLLPADAEPVADAPMARNELIVEAASGPRVRTELAPPIAPSAELGSVILLLHAAGDLHSIPASEIDAGVPIFDIGEEITPGRYGLRVRVSGIDSQPDLTDAAEPRFHTVEL